MEKITKFPRVLFATLFVLSAGFAFATQPATASIDAKKGCWYEPGNPPGCDICGYSCGSGQVCCTINET